jgi:renalase
MPAWLSIFESKVDIDMIDVLVIGAGISGLLCASELQRAGVSTRVLDKGRGVGGRMATRRMGGGRFDHGAQFFTVREPSFQSHVDEWLEAGVIQEWFRHAPSDSNAAGYPRYCGRSGMTDVAKYLCESLEVHRSQAAVEVVRTANAWEVRTATGEVHQCRYLVVTAPVPQALALLDTSAVDYAGVELAALRAVRYNLGLATLAILDGPSGLANHGACPVEESSITWIADNQQKGISMDVPAVTIHASADFAQEHWDSADDVRGALMLEAASAHLQSSVLEYSCHRWGFTLPLNPYPQAYFHNSDLSLLFAGDGFGGPRVEGAALSGLAASRVILDTLSGG